MSSKHNEVFETIYHATFNILSKYVYFKVAYANDAEDIIQNIYINYYNYIIRKNKTVENVQSYLMQIANNELSKYYKNKQEVDFLVNTAKGIKLINVAYSISETETRKREINGLCSAMDALNLKEAFLITNDKEELVSVKNKKK